MKRILSAVISFTLCFSAFSAISGAAASLSPDVSISASIQTDSLSYCGPSATWSLSNGTFTVKGSGPMNSWEMADDTPWSSQKSQIRTVVIEKGITSVGAAAFADCPSLSSVSIPDTITIVERGAFDTCPSLGSVELPSSVATIGMDAFRKCSQLRSVTVYNPDCYFGGIKDTISNTVADSHGGATSYSGVIRGYSGSTAESFAKKSGYNFNSLGNIPKPTTTTTTTTTTTSSSSSITSTTITKATTTSTAKKTTAATKTSTTSKTTTSAKPTTTVNPPAPETFTTVKDGSFTYRIYSDHAEFEKCERFFWGEVNIPNEKSGVPVTAVLANAFKDRMMVSAVTVPETVKSIAASSFSGSGCKTVTILGVKCDINKDCGINCKVRGYDNSTAQAYASEKGLAFESLGPSPAPAPSASPDVTFGDSNCDTAVDLSDAVLIMQAFANPNKYGITGTHESHITDQGLKNGDVFMRGDGITMNDAATIQLYLLGKLESLPADK